MTKTLQDVLAMCKENNIKMVDFKMTDIGGSARELDLFH